MIFESPCIKTTQFSITLKPKKSPCFTEELVTSHVDVILSAVFWDHSGFRPMQIYKVCHSCKTLCRVNKQNVKVRCNKLLC